MRKDLHKTSASKKPVRKKRERKMPPFPMRLIDRLQALARNAQYARDFKFWNQGGEKRPSLEWLLEKDPIILAQKQQIKDRKQRAGLIYMIDPCEIPGLIRKARSTAAELVPSEYNSNLRYRNREHAVLEKMEQLLPLVFEKELTAVRQIFYNHPPTEYEGQMVDTSSGIRDGKYCTVEIDLTSGTRDELLEQVGAIIDNGRSVINFKRSPQKRKIRVEPDPWDIYDMIKKNSTNPHKLAKEKLGQFENSAFNSEVHMLSKKNRSAFRYAEQMVEDIYPSAS